MKWVKHKYIRYFLLGIYIIILGGVTISHLIHHTSVRVDPKLVVPCNQTGQVHEMRVTSTGFIPPTVTTHVCDVVVFVNADTKYHQVAFGDHQSHLIYPGFHEVPMPANETNAVILTARGRYKLHDHFYEDLEAEIIVNN